MRVRFTHTTPVQEFTVTLLHPAWAVAAACLIAMPAAGQTASATTPTARPDARAPAGLYQALGEKAGISRLMDVFVERAVKDPRIGSHFKDTKPQALKDSLTDQICHLSGGPCQYEGADMKSAHADMDITKAHFNALVEVLQAAMAAQGIPFAQQNRLLALLAPMHRDIITVR
jgi:hemoglobin